MGEKQIRSMGALRTTNNLLWLSWQKVGPSKVERAQHYFPCESTTWVTGCMFQVEIISRLLRVLPGQKGINLGSN